MREKGGGFLKEDKSLSLERRKIPRLKDKVFIFGNLRQNPAEEFKAFSEDISAGGLMFETERAFPVQDKLELEMYQPMAHDKGIIFSIPVLAKVAWMRRIEKNNFEPGENKYRVGIEFSEIKEKDRKLIAAYVEKKASRE